MLKKSFVAAGTAAALTVAPINPAQADSGFAKGLAAGIIGAIIVHEVNKNRHKVHRPHYNHNTVVVPKHTYVAPSVAPDSPERAANRVTQTALNFFEFNAGAADGIFGPKTAHAVTSYQAFMGFPQTGTLAPLEREVLISAFNRGKAGDFETLQLTSTNPLQERALLLASRDQIFGPNAGGVFADGGTNGGNVVVSTSNGTNTPVAPNLESTAGGDDLPLLPIPVSAADPAGHCDTVRGGAPVITAASMTDPEAAMVQLFCEARSQAIATSNVLIDGIASVPREQIVAQCAQLGPVMQPHVAALATKGRGEVLSDVSAFVTTSGADPAQLASTAEICLGTGYELANMDVASGSALLLASMGRSGYGELLGHHLKEGFGIGENSDRAMDWLAWTADELSTGATPIFGDTARTALLDEAVLALNSSASGLVAKSSSSKGRAPTQ